LAKILAKVGDSLADSYDVVGSIAGTEELVSREVSLIHEMGSTIFSERLTSHITKISSGSLAQNASFDVVSSPFEECANRISMVQFIADAASKFKFCSLMLEDPNGDLEFPIDVWCSAAATTSGSADSEAGIRFDPDGTGAASMSWLRPTLAFEPTVISRMGGVTGIPTLIFRGTASAFGGGTAELFCYVHHMRPASLNPLPGAERSHGLPLPSW